MLLDDNGGLTDGVELLMVLLPGHQVDFMNCITCGFQVKYGLFAGCPEYWVGLQNHAVVWVEIGYGVEDCVVDHS